VLNLDVYMNILYIVCVNCAGFLILTVLVILFSKKKFIAQTNLRRLRMSHRRLGHRRLAGVIYVGRAKANLR
jgi:hypothetical protein